MIFCGYTCDIVILFCYFLFMSVNIPDSPNKSHWKWKKALLALAIAGQLFSACNSSDEGQEPVEKYFRVQPKQSITSIVRDSLDLTEEQRNNPRLCHLIVESVIADNDMENPNLIHPGDSIRVIPEHVQSTIDEYLENEKQKALLQEQETSEMEYDTDTPDGADDALDVSPTGKLTLSWGKVPEYIRWRAFWDLYAGYLWAHYDKNKRVWDKISLGNKRTWNKNVAIKNLYEKKLSRKNTKWFKVAGQHYKETVSKIDFEKVHPISLEQYEKNIGNIVKELRDGIDWEKLGKGLFHWDKEKLSLLKKLANNIDEKVLTSYSMTEFFPSEDWELNKNLLDFLLQNAGEEYLSYFPAVSDDYTSFGQYQFTSLALYDTPQEKRWASIINQYVNPSLRIPWSVCKLKGKSHHRAAFLFAIYNLSTLLKNADGISKKAVGDISKAENKSDLTQLIAIMHNKPKAWVVFLKEWYQLRNDKKYAAKKTKNYKYDINKNGRVDLYEVYAWMHPISSQYGRKTYKNYSALRK